MFLSENKLYDKKDSSLTKHYYIKSKLIALKTFLPSLLIIAPQITTHKPFIWNKKVKLFH